MQGTGVSSSPSVSTISSSTVSSSSIVSTSLPLSSSSSTIPSTGIPSLASNETMSAPSAFAPLSARRKISGPPAYTGTGTDHASSLLSATSTSKKVVTPPQTRSSPSIPLLSDRTIPSSDTEGNLTHTLPTIMYRDESIREESSSFTDYSLVKTGKDTATEVTNSSSSFVPSSTVVPRSSSSSSSFTSSLSVLPVPQNTAPSSNSRDRTESSTSVTIELNEPSLMDIPSSSSSSTFPSSVRTVTVTSSPVSAKPYHHHHHQPDNSSMAGTSVSPTDAIDPLSTVFSSPVNSKQKQHRNGSTGSSNQTSTSGTKLSHTNTSNATTNGNRRKNTPSSTTPSSSTFSSPPPSQSGNGRRSPWLTTNNFQTNPSPSFISTPTLSTGSFVSHPYTPSQPFTGRQRGDSGVVDAWFANGLSGPATPSSNSTYANGNNNNMVVSRFPQPLLTTGSSPFTDSDMSHLVRGVENVTASPVHILNPFSPSLPATMFIPSLPSSSSSYPHETITKTRKLLVTHATDGGYSADLDHVNDDAVLPTGNTVHRSHDNASRQGNSNNGNRSGSGSAAVSPFPNLDQIPRELPPSTSTNSSHANTTKRSQKSTNGRLPSDKSSSNNGYGRNSAEDKYVYHRPSSVNSKLREILTDDSPESVTVDKLGSGKYDDDYRPQDTTPSFPDDNHSKDDNHGNLWKQRQLTSSPPRFRAYSTDMNPIPEHATNPGTISPIPVEGDEEITNPVSIGDGPKRPSTATRPSDGWMTFGTSTASNTVRENNNNNNTSGSKENTNKGSQNTNNGNSKNGRQTPQSPSRISSPSGRISPRRNNYSNKNSNQYNNGVASNPLASPVGKLLPSSLMSPPPTQHYHPSQPQQPSFHQLQGNNTSDSTNGNKQFLPPLPHPGLTGVANSAFIVPSPVRQFSDSQTPNIYRLPQTLAARSRLGNFTLPTVNEVGNASKNTSTVNHHESNGLISSLPHNYSPIKGFINELMKNDGTMVANKGGDNPSLQSDNAPRQYVGNDEESSLPASGPASTNVSAPGSPLRNHPLPSHHNQTTHTIMNTGMAAHTMGGGMNGMTTNMTNVANTLQNYSYSLPNGHISPLPIAMTFGQNGELVSYSPVNFAMVSSLANMTNIPSNPSPPLVTNGYNGTVSPPPQLMNMQGTYTMTPSSFDGMHYSETGWMNGTNTATSNNTNKSMVPNSLMYSNTNTNMWNTNMTTSVLPNNSVPTMVNTNTVRTNTLSLPPPHPPVNPSLYPMYATNPVAMQSSGIGSNPMGSTYNVYTGPTNNGNLPPNSVPYGNPNPSHHPYANPYGPYGSNTTSNHGNHNPNNLSYMHNGMTILPTINNSTGMLMNNNNTNGLPSQMYRAVTPSVDVGLSAESPAWTPHVKPTTSSNESNSTHTKHPSYNSFIQPPNYAPGDDNRDGTNTGMNHGVRRTNSLPKENSSFVTGSTSEATDEYYHRTAGKTSRTANGNLQISGNNNKYGNRTKEKTENNSNTATAKPGNNIHRSNQISNNNNNMSSLTTASSHPHSTLNTSLSSISTLSSKASITSNGVSIQDILKTATTARRNGDTTEARRILENLTRESKGMRDPAVWIELFRLYDENSVPYNTVIRPAMERAIASALRTLTTTLHSTNNGSVPEETLGLKLIHIAGRNRDTTFLQSMVDTAMNNVLSNSNDGMGNGIGKIGGSSSNNHPIMRYSAQHLWRILAQIANIEAKWNHLDYAYSILGIYAPGFIESLHKVSASGNLVNTSIDITSFVLPLNISTNGHTVSTNSNPAVPAWAGPAILEIVAFIEKWQSLRMAIESCRMAISIFPRYGPLAFTTLRYLEMQAHNEICNKVSHLVYINNEIESSVYDAIRTLCANVPNEPTATNNSNDDSINNRTSSPVSTWKLILFSKIFRHHFLLPRFLPGMDMHEILNTLSAYIPQYLSGATENNHLTVSPYSTNKPTASPRPSASSSVFAVTTAPPPSFPNRENRRYSLAGFPEDTMGADWRSPKYISTYKTKNADNPGQEDILYDIRHGPNVSMSDFETKKRNDHFELNVSTLNAGVTNSITRNNASSAETIGGTIGMKDNVLDLSAISLESSSLLPDMEDHALGHEFADLQEKLVDVSVRSIPTDTVPSVPPVLPSSSVSNEAFIIEIVEAGRRAERVLGQLLLNIDTIASAVPQLSAYMQVANDAARYITKESLSRLHIEICGTYTRAHMICAALTKELLIYRSVTKLLLAQVDHAVAIVSYENSKPYYNTNPNALSALQEYLNFVPLHSAAGVIGKIDNIIKDISINQANKLLQGINTELDTVLGICHPGQRWRSYLSRVRTTLHTAILSDTLRIYGIGSPFSVFMDKFIYTAASRLSVSHSSSSSGTRSSLNSSFMQTITPNLSLSSIASAVPLASLWNAVEASVSPFITCSAAESETIRTALENATQSANESVRPFVFIEAGRYAEISGRIDDARKHYGMAIEVITNEPSVSPEGDSNLSPVPSNTPNTINPSTNGKNTNNNGKSKDTTGPGTRSSRSAANDWKIWQSSALCELRAGNPRGAMQLCTQALTLVPGSGRIWALAAQIQMHIADTLFPLANDVSFTDTDSISKYPDYPPFTPLASSAGYNLHTIEQSNIRALIYTARVVRMAVARTPKSGEVWIEAGRIHANPLGPFFDLPAAHACFDRAAELTSQCGDVFVEATRSIIVRNILAALPSSSRLLTRKGIKENINIDKILQDTHLNDTLNEAIRTEPNYGSCWISSCTWSTYETRERTQQIIYRIRNTILQQYLDGGSEYVTKMIADNASTNDRYFLLGMNDKYSDHRRSNHAASLDSRNEDTITSSSATATGVSCILPSIFAYLEATYSDNTTNNSTKVLPIWYSRDNEYFLTLPDPLFPTDSSTSTTTSTTTIFLPSLYLSMGFVRTIALMTLPPHNILNMGSNTNNQDIAPYKYYRVQSPMDRLQILYGGDSF